ncbi:MAG: alpha/beta hydrolase [Clostridia bacterium]|nr:alpha/beta hydrolase [Clostridia bacterium]
MNYLFKSEVVDYDVFNNGKAQTILFLHGWGGNKFSFQQTINLLKNQFNILSITMPSIDPTVSIWDMFDYVTLVENILSLHSITSVITICHSFGFRVAMLLNKKIKIEKIVVTGGAGPKKYNIFKKISQNSNKIMLKSNKFKDFYKKIASPDYLKLSKTNKETFKNVVNLNLKFAIKFNCPMLLFWGKKDKETPLWIAKKLQDQNKARLITVFSNHFAYLHKNTNFTHEVINFLTN